MQNFFQKYGWNVLIGSGIVAFAIFAVINIIPKKITTQTDQTASRTDITTAFAPPANTQLQTSPTVPTINSPEVRGQTPPPSPSRASTNTSGMQWQDYRNDQFAFSASLPAGSNVIVNNSQITANGPVGSYWQITVYDNTPASMSDLEAQLSHSPSVYRVVRTTFAGQPAIQFFSAQVGGSGYAVVYNNRLYYIIGHTTNFRFN